MRNLFIGILYRYSDIPWLSRYSKTSLQVAANNYQWNLIEGVEEKNRGELDIFSFLPMGSFPKNSKKLFIDNRKSRNGKNGLYLSIGSINFYFIKELIRFGFLLFAIRRWIKNSPWNSNIIVYSLYTPFLWTMKYTQNLRRKKGINYILIVPDLPGKYGIAPAWHTLTGLFYWIDSFFLLRLSRNADSYIFLTESMTKIINIHNKPYVVIEGMVSRAQIEMYNRIPGLAEVETGTKIILYSGSFLKEFGIDNLLNAFLTIGNSKFELWLCGPPAEAELVLKFSNIDPRIKYLGFLQNEELIKAQKSATVLINPRPVFGEYVKYSFPSKTMEYLLSGRPLIMAKLPGLPTEYYDFIYFLSDTKADIIAKTILDICGRSREELNDFGYKAKMFVIRSKNSLAQAKKLDDISRNSMCHKGA